MKKLFAALILVATLTYTPTAVFAQSDVCDLPGSDNSAFCEGQTQGEGDTATDNSVLDILATVVEVLTTITAIAATIVIIIGGLMFTVAGGDPGRVSRARSAIIYAIVALVVAIFSRVIITFVLTEIA